MIELLSNISKMNINPMLPTWCLGFLLSYCCALQLTHRFFYTPNHKAILTSPISSSPTSVWLLLNTSQPSTWSLSNAAASVPFESNGTTGISIDFGIIENGLYTCEVEIECGNISNGPIQMSIDGVSGIKWAVGSRCYYSFVKNLTPGNFSYFLWAQNMLKVSYISVSSTTRVYPTSISLQHHPSQHLLLLITNISSSLLANTTKFIQKTKVKLNLKTNIPASCSMSMGAATNPADFAGYASQTNFQSEAKAYQYSLIEQGNLLRQNIQSGIIVVGVTSILVDCTVDVKVQLGDGLVFADKYWIVFDQSINQTLEYIETSINVAAVGRYYSYIFPQQITVILQNLAFNPDWDLEEMKTKVTMQISNTSCQVFFFTSENNFLKAFCHNITPAINTSTYTTALPSLYLRDKATLSLLNITVVSDTTTPWAYVVDRFMTADVYYYMGNSILQVLYSVQIEPSWRSNLSLNNIAVSINGFAIPSSWIRLINDSSNNVAAELCWVGLTNSDSVNVQFLSNWQLDSAEGYHNQWFRTAPSNIYFIPGNSPNPAGPSFNSTNQSAISNGTNEITEAKSGLTVYFLMELVQLIKYYTKSYRFFAFAYFFLVFLQY